MLPEGARKRALELIANECKVHYQNPVHCTQVAAYVAGFAHQVDLPNDDVYLSFRYRPQELLSKLRTEKPKPGDMAVFSAEGFPEHFAIFLGEDLYFYKIGQGQGFAITSESEIKKKYHTNHIDFFSSQIKSCLRQHL